MKETKNIQSPETVLSGGFWKSRKDMLADQLIPYQWETLNNRTPGAPLSHAVENFRIAAGEAVGEPQGTIFQDSDVAKWIEAASYSLMSHPNTELEAKIDELVRLIEKSQQADGYVNTFFIAANDTKRWSDLTMGHELYCAGHMIEAAVAYFQATGKRRLMDVMRRYADHITEIFGPGDNQNHSYDGHPEIELALYRLAEETGEEKYAELADHFVNIRSSVKDFHVGKLAMHGIMPKSRWFLADYYLAHVPVREMEKADGHAVRAVYLYSAMADQYRRTNDPALLAALKSIWRNVVSRRMYITAGLGSQAHGERFTVDYDLPSATAYTESCASVGLVFWAWRMSLIDRDGEYADIIERAIYNGTLSGVSLNGKQYFYVNPLEVSPRIAGYREDHDHVETHRLKWLDCACCPTNIARLIASIHRYMSFCSPGELYMHQYMSGTVDCSPAETPVRITVDTRYPWDGTVRFNVESSAPTLFTLHLRIPRWCRRYTLKVNDEVWTDTKPENGYMSIRREWSSRDTVELEMDMPVRIVRGNSRVQDLAGKVAIMRGPMVYCVEEADNGKDLHQLILDPSVPAVLETDDSLLEKTVVINLRGFRDTKTEELYYDFDESAQLNPSDIRAIPYFQWGNRTEDQEMRVWLRIQQ